MEGKVRWGGRGGKGKEAHRCIMRQLARKDNARPSRVEATWPSVGRTEPANHCCEDPVPSSGDEGRSLLSPPSKSAPLVHGDASLTGGFLFKRVVNQRHHRFHSSVAAPPTAAPSSPLLLLCLLLVCFFGGAVEGRSSDNFGDGGMSSATDQKENYRITCYTCVNVSNNDECNRFAIDRPCPEGGDYCLTLHVMDAVDRERSVLVNKRCASLDDCIGDATGCNTAYGQTQCVSCCDQPYCNDSVPSNSTNAVFYRSAASAVVAEKRRWDLALTAANVLMLPVLKVFLLGTPS